MKPVILVSHTYSPNIQVALCESFRFADLREELVRFFLMDYALRNHGNVTDVVEKRGADLIPEWLWAGVSEAIGFRENGEPSELFAAVYQAGTIMSVDEILKASPEEMNSLSRAVYRASAGGLVLTLLQHDAGPARMRNFIDALASPRRIRRRSCANISLAPTTPTIVSRSGGRCKPPSLRSRHRSMCYRSPRRRRSSSALSQSPSWSTRRIPLGKGMARLSRLLADLSCGYSKSAAERLPQSQSLNPLGRIRSSSSGSPMRWRITGLSNPGQIWRSCYTAASCGSSSLATARSRSTARSSNPTCEIIADIGSGDTQGLDAQFAALAETRAGLLRSGQMVEDIMNLEEATCSQPGLWCLRRIPQTFEHLRRSKPARQDEISKYLDRVQAEFE